MLQFGKLSDLIDNADLLDMEESLQDVFSKEKNQSEVIRLNTEEQLFNEGVDSNNTLLSSIGGSYAPLTMELKSRPDLNRTRIDLFDTGAFYGSFGVEAERDHLIISADTIKDGQDLRDRWGPFIIGLNEESRERIARFISLPVMEYALNALINRRS